MKQTAVEWLIKEFSAILGPIKTEPMQDMLLGDAFKKAKEMEREQIKDAYNIATAKGYGEAEQYYNATYKQNG